MIIALQYLYLLQDIIRPWDPNYGDPSVRPSTWPSGTVLNTRLKFNEVGKFIYIKLLLMKELQTPCVDLYFT